MYLFRHRRSFSDPDGYSKQCRTSCVRARCSGRDVQGVGRGRQRASHASGSNTKRVERKPKTASETWDWAIVERGVRGSAAVSFHPIISGFALNYQDFNDFL